MHPATLTRCHHTPVLSIASQDAAFRQATAARWQQLRAGPLADAWFTGEIDSAQATISPDATNRNYARWAPALGSPLYATWPEQYASEVGFLRNWTLARLSWMDGALSKLAAPGAGPDAYLLPAGAPVPAAAAAAPAGDAAAVAAAGRRLAA